MITSERKLFIRQFIGFTIDYLIIRFFWLIISVFSEPSFLHETIFTTIAFFLVFAFLPWQAKGYSPGGRLVRVKLVPPGFLQVLYRFAFIYMVWFTIRFLLFASENMEPAFLYFTLYILLVTLFMLYLLYLYFYAKDKRLYFDRWSNIRIFQRNSNRFPK